MSLSHIVGLVTGGASGLGAATVSTLIQGGARVVVADLPHQYERFDSSTTAANNISFVETDVTREDQVEKALDTVEELYGEPGE